MRLRDTLTGALRELEPGPDGTIGFYVCGPTVYDRIHVGNGRPVVVFLQMKRYLEWRGQRVRLVENITDINDKIYAAANARGVRSDELAAEMTRAFIADTDRLGLGRPDEEPLASATIPEIVALIEELVAGGHAYEAGGDVYFAVRSFDRYGELSGQRPDDVESGARVEPGEHKRDPVDFALWKATKADEDTSWPSPWGDGRPAWHIECSAMAEKLLGREFAVHGGGRDLIFPHHENEIAQSCSIGRGFARVWAHNGMLQLAGEKMSKSEGNIETLETALDTWGPETLIMLFLQAHYASPLAYSDATLEQARTACETLRNRLRTGAGEDAAVRGAVWEALDDDFSTPRALAALFRAPPEARDTVAEVLDVLGLGGLARSEAAPAEVVELAEARRAARERSDFPESDRLRDEIAALGWEVRDTAGGYELVRRG
ncbi:MAG TPA: cysteine--tRNA ligase [Gaiellales bacterium]|nr:cysteine--tRNA ligase [Gaiellales bacterium]